MSASYWLLARGEEEALRAAASILDGYVTDWFGTSYGLELLQWSEAEIPETFDLTTQEDLTAFSGELAAIPGLTFRLEGCQRTSEGETGFEMTWDGSRMKAEKKAL